MKRYRLLVTRNCTESTVVDVSALDKQSAQDKALAEAQSFPERFTWTLDDGSGGCDLPYLGDDSLDAVEEIK
jgi:hypothetical protein